MSLRQYLVVLALGTAISLSSWCIIMIAIDPATAGTLAYVVFYLTLFAGIAGLFSLCGTVFRSWRAPHAPIDHAVARSFRQGMLLSGLVVTCLVLLAASLFSFGTMMLLVVLVGLVEFLFLSISQENREV